MYKPTNMYTAIKGVYENGSLTFLEPIPNVEKSEVIVMFLNEGLIKQVRPRVPGSLKRIGMLEGKKYSIPDDFNEPLDDLNDYM